MADGHDQAMTAGLAGGAIATELLAVLFDKGILSLDESRAILDRAIYNLGSVVQTPNGFAASRIIRALQQGKFAARG
jgi:hypothetical protein